MARLKSGLLKIFDGCESNRDIYRAMLEAKKLGYGTDEVAMAVAKVKKSLTGQSAEYKRLFLKDVSINYIQQYHVGYPVVVRNINNKTIVLSKEGVVL